MKRLLKAHRKGTISVFMTCFILLSCLVCLMFMKDACADEPLLDKTLVVWTSLENLEQRGGSALTIDNRHGGFDAVVFGELCPQRWMPGSTGFMRTEKEQNSWFAETAASGDIVQIAIVYQGNQVKIYRNANLYAAYTMPTPPQEFKADAVIMFGSRHMDVIDKQESYTGTIQDARIYAQALEQEDIAALRPCEATGPATPWAWWTFGTGSLQEQTGRYSEVRLIGDVKASNKGLVLNGNGATLIAYPNNSVDEAGLWPKHAAVPRQVINSSRALREHLLDDQYRPGYHFVFPEDNGMPGDPNGALYWNGRYHLMYLFHDGEAFVWGHVSSKDLVHWRYHPVMLGPGQGDTGIFSGGACVDKSGTAVITYWGLGDAPQGICIARSNDEQLDTWTKSPNNPVIRSTHFGYNVEIDENGKDVIYGSADPSNIWIKDGRYYMLTGNLLVLNRYGKELNMPEYQGDTVYLFVSDDLENWKYLHPFYKSDRNWTHAGEDNMCPNFFPLPASPDGGAPSDKHLMLQISHCDGCQYYIGEYKDDYFIPQVHGRMTWKDNAYFAPEALMDAQGRLIMWAWILDNPPQNVIDAQGWQGIYGLPRVLWLGGDGQLRMKPVDELKILRQEENTWPSCEVVADSEKYMDFNKDMYELEFNITPGDASQCGVKVCCSSDGQEETLIYYDAIEKKLCIDTRNSSLGFGRKEIEGGPFELAAGESLNLRVFVDKSIVEVYANDRQAVARRIYPTLNGKGISLFAKGGVAQVTTIKAWELMPSNPF